MAKRYNLRDLGVDLMFQIAKEKIKTIYGERITLNKREQKYRQLILKHFDLIKNEPMMTKYLYCLALAYSQKKFSQLISDCDQELPIPRDIARHNLKVEIILKSVGINFKTWFNYRDKKTIELIEHDREQSQELWSELEALLVDLLKCFDGTELYRSIRKDAINIQKRKLEIQAGLFKIPDTRSDISQLFPVFEKSCAYLFSKKGKTVSAYWHWYGEVSRKIYYLLQIFSGQAVKKQYSVQLWRRDPQLDLFQGNYSGCCIAVGEPKSYPAADLRLPGVDYKKYPAGILEYLIDKGIQVAVAREGGWGAIGQCWLFLTQNENGGADLVADSFDLNSSKVMSHSQRKAIRSCMFQFLKNYAAAIGAHRVLLGKNGQVMPNGKRREIMNDVEVKYLPEISLQNPIEKLGGYFMNRPYFLESRLGNKAFEIAR